MKTLNDHASDIGAALARMVTDGRLAREDVAARIRNHADAEALAYAFTWARGVEQDILGAYAARMLEAMDRGRPLLAVLEWVIVDCSEALHGHRFAGNSTSAFRNGVDQVRAEVARHLYETCRRWREELVAIRAEGELL